MGAFQRAAGARGRERDAPRRGPTYYGLPAVKASPWHGLVWSYVFVAGLAGSAQILATLADLLGGRELRGIVRRGRLLALLGPALGAPLLIADLYTPRRFYNMLRIFRATSPMSIGTYVLGAFSLLSGLTLLGQVLGERGSSAGRRLARTAQVPAALAGAGMSVYTAALLAATSTPLWAAAPRLLAARFGCSAMASAAAALSLAGRLAGEREAGSRRLDRVAMVAVAGEALAGRAAERRCEEAGVHAIRDGRRSAEERLGAVLLGAGVPLALHAVDAALPRRTAALPVAASIAVLAGGLLMRRMIMEAGNRSAERPDDYFRLTAAAPGRRR